MRIIRADSSSSSSWNTTLTQLEASISYPLGTDRFHLDHGQDYFAFFRRLGEIHCYLAHEEGKVLGLGQGILRRLPDGKLAWYLCDLKARPEARGKKLTYRLFKKAFLRCYLRCRRGYGITMNDAHGYSPIVKLTKKLPFTPLEVAAKLSFFSLDHVAMTEILPLLKEHRGPIGFHSHEGVKDLVLESTKMRLPLLHAQWGELGTPTLTAPRPGHTHMFCVPEHDPLHALVLQGGHPPTATATLLAHGMKHTNWAFVLSSDV